MSASLTLDAMGLHRIAARFQDPSVKLEIENLPQKKAVAALVAQAIADNFDQEGPGWAPLKGSTIKYSVAKKMRAAMQGLSSKEIEHIEAKRKKKGQEPNRVILQKTGLLKKTVTSPGYKGSVKGSSGSNIWKQEGHNLVWGTDLVYAGVHQHGSPRKGIPARPFLTIREHWMEQIKEYVIEQIMKIVKSKIVRGV